MAEARATAACALGSAAGVGEGRCATRAQGSGAVPPAANRERPARERSVPAGDCAWAAAGADWLLCAPAPRAGVQSAERVAALALAVAPPSGFATVAEGAPKANLAIGHLRRSLSWVDPNHDSQSCRFGIGLSLARRKPHIAQKSEERRLYLKKPAVPPQSSVLGR